MNFTLIENTIQNDFDFIYQIATYEEYITSYNECLVLWQLCYMLHVSYLLKLEICKLKSWCFELTWCEVECNFFRLGGLHLRRFCSPLVCSIVFLIVVTVQELWRWRREIVIHIAGEKHWMSVIEYNKLTNKYSSLITLHYLYKHPLVLAWIVSVLKW